jgi:hypothetical protein
MDYKVKRSFYLSEIYYVTGTTLRGLDLETGDRLVALGVAEAIGNAAGFEDTPPPKPPRRNAAKQPAGAGSGE